MKYAIAMYRAGAIVNASDCDYDSAKQLGLICPFCSEAVFLRSGFARSAKTRQQVLVEPAFCHYKNDNPGADDCELRAIRPDGHEYIEKLRIECRNQRLELYNNFLWEMIRDDWGTESRYTRTAELRLRKVIGDRRLQANVTQSRLEWGRQIATVYDRINTVIYQFSQAPLDERSFKEMSARGSIEYFQNKADMPLHQTICNEIADFLATRTAGYVFQKLYLAAILVGMRFDRGTPQQEIQTTLQTLPPDTLLPLIATLIANIRWIDHINKRQTSP